VDEYTLPQDLQEALSGDTPPTVIDVRGEKAYRAGHVAGAVHIPADEIERSLERIPRDRPVVTV